LVHPLTPYASWRRTCGGSPLSRERRSRQRRRVVGTLTLEMWPGVVCGPLGTSFGRIPVKMLERAGEKACPTWATAAAPSEEAAERGHHPAEVPHMEQLEV